MFKYFSLSLFLFSAIELFAQPDLSYFLPAENYDPSIPVPSSIIGHEVGEWHITHDKLVQYMYALAESSDRISIRETGRTYEGRPLLILYITSPENQKNLENIKREHISLSMPSGQKQPNFSEMPAVVYMGFSIHGNEPSGSNAALLTAYYLAASSSEAIKNSLENIVILFDPSFNPDGLQRFASWVNSRKSAVTSADPLNMEQNEPWPRGRTNHYWFDLNRDWLPSQLPESRARLKTYHEWKPNVLTDHHEMGTNSTFFFQPGIPSRNNPLTPARTYELTEAIARFHAKALDSIGSLYFTKENYDDFYYGKGSTYPDINGGVGILFEQASSRGHMQESNNGVLTFPFTIRNQFNTTLSTLKAATELREELLRHQADFYSSAMKESSDKGYYLLGTSDPWRLYEFAQLLERHQIHYKIPEGSVQINGRNYLAGESLMIPGNQPQSRLITSMFERRTSFTDSLFYDISAWNMPMAFNLDYQELPLRSLKDLPVKESNVIRPQGIMNGGEASYAYAIRWDNYYSPAILNSILTQGIRVRAATASFNGTNGRKYDRGTLIIPVNNQDIPADSIYSLLKKATAKFGISADALDGGLDFEGKSLGSPSFESIDLPKTALLVGDGVNSYDAGEVWHLFDTRMEMPLTLIPTDRISRADLSRYNRIIMVDGSYSDIGETGKENLKSWVRAGGTLIAFKDAISSLRGMGMGNFDFRKNNKADSARQRPYADISADRGADELGGSIFEVQIDLTHPLFYGYKRNKMAVFKDDRLFMEPSVNGFANPAIYSNSPVLSGYISKENLQKLTGSSAIGVSSFGRGKIIAFTNNLNFRAFWFGTNKVFMNAIFFGPTISGGATR